MTGYPSRCNRSTSPLQPLASAKAPCTKTTVGRRPSGTSCEAEGCAAAPVANRTLTPSAPAIAPGSSELRLIFWSVLLNFIAILLAFTLVDCTSRESARSSSFECASTSRILSATPRLWRLVVAAQCSFARCRNMYITARVFLRCIRVATHSHASCSRTAVHKGLSRNAPRAEKARRGATEDFVVSQLAHDLDGVPCGLC